MAAPSLARVQAALVAAVLLGCVGILGYLACVAPQVAFLPPHQDDGWIGFPLPVRAEVYRTPQPPEPFVFERRFELESVPRAAELEARALFTLTLELNGAPLVPEPRDAFREPVVLDVAEHLRAGENLLRAEVRNPMGAALLRIRLREGGGLLLASDPGWQVTAPGLGTAAARPADDTLRLPEALRAPEPAEVLAEKSALLLGLVGLCAALVYALDGRLPRGALRHAPLALLLVLSAGWLALLVGRLSTLPLEVGFDAESHLAYAAHLRSGEGLPVATQGIAMYHPPLFYALLAGLTALAGVPVGAADAGLVHRMVPMGMGLASVWMVWLAARRVFAGDPLRSALAVGFAGLLPMHVYMSAFVSNESTSTFAASAFLAAALAAILSERIRLPAALGVAALGGLAMLAKNSTLVLVPLALGVLGLRLWLVDGRSLPRAVASGALLLLGSLVVGGWFYARNWLLLGTLLPFSTATGGEGLWWHLPGFHTLEYFTRFGESLRHPLFAGLHAYADGVYASFWGDAYAAGSRHALGNPAGWALKWMLLGYLPALPVTLLVLAGGVRAAGRAARGRDLRARLAWTLVVGVLAAMAASHLTFSVRYPSYAATKAFYALPAFLPLALAAGLGLAWPLERCAGAWRRPLRAVLLGALLTFAGVLVRSFAG